MVWCLGGREQTHGYQIRPPSTNECFQMRKRGYDRTELNAQRAHRARLQIETRMEWNGGRNEGSAKRKAPGNTVVSVRHCLHLSGIKEGKTRETKRKEGPGNQPADQSMNRINHRLFGRDWIASPRNEEGRKRQVGSMLVSE